MYKHTFNFLYKLSRFILRPSIKTIKADIFLAKEDTLEFIDKYKFNEEQQKYFQRYVADPNLMCSGKDEVADQVYKEMQQYWIEQLSKANVLFSASLLSPTDYLIYIECIYQARDDIQRYFIPGLGTKMAEIVMAGLSKNERIKLTNTIDDIFSNKQQSKPHSELSEYLKDLKITSEEDLN